MAAQGIDDALPYSALLAGAVKAGKPYYDYLYALNLGGDAESIAIEPHLVSNALHRLYKNAKKRSYTTVGAENLECLARFGNLLAKSLRAGKAPSGKLVEMVEAAQEFSRDNLKRRERIRKLDTRDPFKANVRRDQLNDYIFSLYGLIQMVRSREPGVWGRGTWGAKMENMGFDQLPPLRLRSRSEWAKAMMNLIWSGMEYGALNFEAMGKVIVKIANPWRQSKRRVRKALKKLPRQWPDESSLGPLEATRFLMRVKRIARTKPTYAEIRFGFQDAVAERLKSILQA